MIQWFFFVKLLLTIFPMSAMNILQKLMGSKARTIISWTLQSQVELSTPSRRLATIIRTVLSKTDNFLHNILHKTLWYGFLKKYFDHFDYIRTWVLFPVSNKAMFSLWIQDHIFGQESLDLLLIDVSFFKDK